MPHFPVGGTFSLPRVFLYVGIFLLVGTLLCRSPESAFAETEPAAEYDVVVAGGGIGGMAAAIQAARLGAGVLVVEPSDWIGGQATAAGVSTMDDLSRQRSGIYLEFISKMQLYYDAKGKSMGTCYWDSRSLAFEPSLGQKILYEMVEQTRLENQKSKNKNFKNEKPNKKPFDVLLLSSVTAVRREGDAVVGVTIRGAKGTRDVACRVLIDATEYGDVLPLAGAAYRVGNSVTPFLNESSTIQDITWVAIIRKYPRGIPPKLRPRRPLPGYEEARRNYESYVAADGMEFRGTYPVRLPVNFVNHNAYRGLPDSSSPWAYDGRRENWKFITKSGVNWGNDYPGRAGWNGYTGLPIAYIEDRELRARVEKDALVKTLHFIYYMQNELGENWSVTDDEYEHATLPPAARDLPEEWQEIARRMPPIPYVRESRRAVGARTLTSAGLLQNSLSYRDGQTSHEFPDAIAIGGYILDLHGADTEEKMEWDLGEKAGSVEINRPRGPFQVPLDILIPRDVEGLLVAEKNLSMTRLAAGALRLQPICMMVGQAAGALSALSAQSGLAPRDVPPVRVQRALLEAGVVLSLCKYSDVPPEHPFFQAVQLSNLYGLIKPLEPPHAPPYNISDLDDPVLAMAIIRGADRGIFGVDEMITREEMAFMLTLARLASGTSKGEAPVAGEKPERFVSRGTFAETLCATFGFEKRNSSSIGFTLPENHRSFDAIETLSSLGILNLYRSERDFRPARPVTRGEAAEMMMRAMTVEE
ncbi:MAG: FAD-dependent oxidoreductase [Synergistaceae bacterium]|nr:FAD-dependent oxidoreductase [Synergistaceae bacterium]